MLTWDPRELVGCGGTVMFNSPAFEARDAAALVDFVAGQPDLGEPARRAYNARAPVLR